MRALLRIIRDLLKVFVGPRLCDACGLLTNRVTNQQYDRWLDSARRVLPCRCGGQLRALLLHTADTVSPDMNAGLDRIRARTSSTSAAGPAEADQTAPPQ